MLTEYINKIINGNDLTERETEEVMDLLMTREISPVQEGAFLGALQSKGISARELAGGVRSMKKYSVSFDGGIFSKDHKLELNEKKRPDIERENFEVSNLLDEANAFDIVGTGGDGGRSFNISTVAALIAAGAGLKIAKHGGRASSGKCGSADVLEALGFNLSAAPQTMARSLINNGTGFFFAPSVHPLMSKMAAVRKQLGVKSFFNLLGPLANPVPIKGILLGVGAPDQMDLFADALVELGIKRAMVVSSYDHLDEISCFAKTKIIEIRNGVRLHYDLDPNNYFCPDNLKGALTGGEALCNARILLEILDSKVYGAARSVCLLNAGAALYTAGHAESIDDGIRLAEYSIDSGAALRKLNVLIRESRSEETGATFEKSGSEEEKSKLEIREIKNFNSEKDQSRKEKAPKIRKQFFKSQKVDSKKFSMVKCLSDRPTKIKTEMFGSVPLERSESIKLENYEKMEMEGSDR